MPDLSAARAIGDRADEALNADVRLGEHRLALRASVGVAWSDDPTRTADDLLAAADSEMYVAKRRRFQTT